MFESRRLPACEQSDDSPNRRSARVRLLAGVSADRKGSDSQAGQNGPKTLEGHDSRNQAIALCRGAHPAGDDAETKSQISIDDLRRHLDCDPDRRGSRWRSHLSENRGPAVPGSWTGRSLAMCRVRGRVRATEIVSHAAGLIWGASLGSKFRQRPRCPSPWKATERSYRYRIVRGILWLISSQS